ncbi:hypothetical protein LXA43DRAFT_81168 [Ganoderma leucocontextum]|nr:hypothetical protein LXA43DRAFT_81168 [Ganoderma leucocontextum]
MPIFTSFVLTPRLHIKAHRRKDHIVYISQRPPTISIGPVDLEKAHRSGMEDTANPTVSPLEELTRDNDFWLEDGSVVLVAKKTAFKVYKGFLSLHSPVFSDMFSSASHADETYDGCPVVRISDSPEDLKWLLTHLIPRTLLHLEGGHHFKYPELSALARLGHKYQIDVLERHAIGRLKNVFTNDVEQWECQLCFRPSGYLSCDPIDTIHLARLTKNPSMLPLAFYIRAQNEDIIIDGQVREDGTHMVLDKADVKRCISGIRGLGQMSERAIQQTLLLVTSLEPCRTPSGCRSALDVMLDNASQGSRIYLLEGLCDVVLSFTGCATCWQAIKRLRRDQRRELWRKLPQIFGLQNELKGHWPGY